MSEIQMIKLRNTIQFVGWLHDLSRATLGNHKVWDSIINTRAQFRRAPLEQDAIVPVSSDQPTMNSLPGSRRLWMLMYLLTNEEKRCYQEISRLVNDRGDSLSELSYQLNNDPMDRLNTQVAGSEALQQQSDNTQYIYDEVTFLHDNINWQATQSILSKLRREYDASQLALQFIRRHVSDDISVYIRDCFNPLSALVMIYLYLEPPLGPLWLNLNRRIIATNVVNCESISDYLLKQLRTVEAIHSAGHSLGIITDEEVNTDVCQDIIQGLDGSPPDVRKKLLQFSKLTDPVDLIWNMLKYLRRNDLYIPFNNVNSILNGGNDGGGLDEAQNKRCGIVFLNRLRDQVKSHHASLDSKSEQT